MRPALLDPLFASAAALPGVGPRTAKQFDRLLGGQTRVIDLLFHKPTGLVDNRISATIASAPCNTHVVIAARVTEHRVPARHSSKPFSVLVEDETGDILLIFFRNNFDWVERALPIGEIRWFSGDLKLWNGTRQIAHPRIWDARALKQIRPFEPVYPLTEGLFQKPLQKAIGAALSRCPASAPEWLDDATLRRHQFPGFFAALYALHNPQSPGDMAQDTPHLQRAAYDELLSQQIALRLVRNQLEKVKGRATTSEGALAKKLIAALPYLLTTSQTNALQAISGDIGSDKKMLRLLQGDVGSGKTIVALLAMVSVVEAGRQAALMVPTEILAQQHFARIEPLARAIGITTILLTGRDSASQRRTNLAALAGGRAGLVIGTNALVQEGVVFHDLALAVVDEQHRFGVHQRLALGEKGAMADVLVMTATPIPRTLVLTCFGDMDVSSLTEKPVGRQRIETRAMPSERLDDVIDGVGRAISGGARVYWVCPLVSENEESDVAAARQRFEALQHRFGARVGLVHGQMKGRDKDAAMSAFQAGETQILVATTVIEVGVDVPEATIMVIEHAERFGLAQLHQLRGRVGRGAAQSSCILLYKGPLGEIAEARLKILRESDDGFRLAEEDLRLRGEGEVLGTRQSGEPGFIFADMSVHEPLLKLARENALRILEDDPDLTSSRGYALRLLLYIFGREDAVRLLRAG